MWHGVVGVWVYGRVGLARHSGMTGVRRVRREYCSLSRAAPPRMPLSYKQMMDLATSGPNFMENCRELLQVRVRMCV